jgi:superfamily II DNA or RNA helicase
VAKKQFMTYDEAKSYIQSVEFNGKKIQSSLQYRNWRKSGAVTPMTFPRSPNSVYKKNKFSWGDFLGTGRITTLGRTYMSYDEAKTFIQSIEFNGVNIQTEKQFNEWRCLADNVPDNLPRSPKSVYQRCHFTWADFLNTNTKRNAPFMSYDEAKTYIQSIEFNGKKITTSTQFCEWHKTASIPYNFSRSPDKRYRRDNFSWGDFLGTGRISNSRRTFMTYEEAKEYIQSVEFNGEYITTEKKFIEWTNSNHYNTSIPKRPHRYYITATFKWADFLGTGRFSRRNIPYMNYQDAQKYIQSINFNGGPITSGDIFREWINSGVELPEMFPTQPGYAYRNQNFKWRDFLGTEGLTYSIKNYMPYEDAKAYIQSIEFNGAKIKSKEMYHKWYDSGVELPAKLPRTPWTAYRHHGFCTWDFFGKPYKYLWNTERLRNFLQSMAATIDKLSSVERYSILAAAGLLDLSTNTKNQAFKRVISNALNGKQYSVDDLTDFDIDDNDIDIDIDIDDTMQFAEIEPMINDISKHNMSVPAILDTIDTVTEIQKQFSGDVLGDFFVKTRVMMCWNLVINTNKPVDDVISEITHHNTGEYGTKIKNEFLHEFDETYNMLLPNGYSFHKNGQLVQPNLMQKYISHVLTTRTRYGQWSDMGAGKTLSAILASRTLNSKLTVVITVNNTVHDEFTGWAGEIKNAFPDSHVLLKDTTYLQFDTTNPNFLLLNYEKFQLPGTQDMIINLVENHKIDMIVLDEIHSAKKRDNTKESIRRANINAFITSATTKNPACRVLGMSGTPVVNDLAEAVSLLEMVTGDDYSFLSTTNSINNAIEIHKYLVLNGIRFKPTLHTMHLNETIIDIPVSDVEIIKNIAALPKGAMLQMEQQLLQPKIQTIIDNCQPQTIIYTQYVDGIVDEISEVLSKNSISHGFFTGNDKAGLEQFKNKQIDVLIASSPISTGVDGLQYICNKMIIVSLPWTHSLYQQLVCRLYRQGSNFTDIEIVIPKVIIENNGDEWSWDNTRLERIKYKRTLGDCAVDGVIPNSKILSETQEFDKCKEALNMIIKKIENK